MTIDVFKLPEAELTIMQILWDAGAIMTTEQLICAYSERSGRTVKSATINTLAGRLMNKGMLTYVQSGGRNLYMPVCRKEKYQAFAAAQFLKVLFNGSVAEMAFTLLKDERIDLDDWNALMGLEDLVDVVQEEVLDAGSSSMEQKTAHIRVIICERQAVRFAYYPPMRPRKPHTYYTPRAA